MLWSACPVWSFAAVCEQRLAVAGLDVVGFSSDMACITTAEGNGVPAV